MGGMKKYIKDSWVIVFKEDARVTGMYVWSCSEDRCRKEKYEKLIYEKWKDRV